jgi:hypothetical protein
MSHCKCPHMQPEFQKPYLIFSKIKGNNYKKSSEHDQIQTWPAHSFNVFELNVCISVAEIINGNSMMTEWHITVTVGDEKKYRNFNFHSK